MSQVHPQQRSRELPEQADSMLELYLRVLEGKTNDPLLDEINLGSGYYSDREYWLQVDAFRQALFASAAMLRPIMARARHETKWELVNAIVDRSSAKILDGIDYPGPADGQSREDYFAAHGEAIWDSLGTDEWTKRQHQAILINEVTGISHDWVPPHWRMLKMRHKASQSKDAQALDNLFGRVREVLGVSDPDMEDVA